MNDLLQKLLKSGAKTSEFWVMLVALLLPFVIDLPADRIAAWGTAGGWIGGLVAAVYIAARAYIKGKQLQSLGREVVEGEMTERTLDRFDLRGATPGKIADSAIVLLESAAPEGFRWDRIVSRYVQKGPGE